MDKTVRGLHKAVEALSPPDNVKNIRMAKTEQRRWYYLVRFTGVDAINMGKLYSEFPDYEFFVRDINGPCIDVYIPNPNKVKTLLKLGGRVLLIASCSISALVVWTTLSQ